MDAVIMSWENPAALGEVPGLPGADSLRVPAEWPPFVDGICPAGCGGYVLITGNDAECCRCDWQGPADAVSMG